MHAITAEVKAVEADIAAALQLRPHQHLMAIPGVGPLVAAKILGETHDVRHFRSAAAFAAHAGAAPVPASSGNTHRHRLARAGNRQLNRALFTIAMVQARWHPEARAYLAKKRGEGKTAAKPVDASNDTLPASSTGPCSTTSKSMANPCSFQQNRLLLDESGAPTGQH